MWNELQWSILLPEWYNITEDIIETVNTESAMALSCTMLGFRTMRNSVCCVSKKHCRREKQGEYAIHGRRNFSSSYFHQWLWWGQFETDTRYIHLALKGNRLLLWFNGKSTSWRLLWEWHATGEERELIGSWPGLSGHEESFLFNLCIYPCHSLVL